MEAGWGLGFMGDIGTASTLGMAGALSSGGAGAAFVGLESAGGFAAAGALATGATVTAAAVAATTGAYMTAFAATTYVNAVNTAFGTDFASFSNTPGPWQDVVPYSTIFPDLTKGPGLQDLWNAAGGSGVVGGMSMSATTGNPALMLRSTVITLFMALCANLAIWIALVLALGNRDFAGFITGLGSVTAVLGLCHGCVRFWEREGKQLGDQLALAITLTKRASIAGWFVASLSLVVLVAIRPSGWTAWMYGIVWGVVGGAVFAITFRIITKNLLKHAAPG